MDIRNRHILDEPINTPITKMDLELKGLGQFIGTTRYFNVLGYNVTDGVYYIMENGYSWFVTDFLAVVRFNQKLRNEGFLSIYLKLDGNKAKMEVTDGNRNILYTQKYQWTDVKRELNLYFTNNVLMLSNEY